MLHLRVICPAERTEDVLGVLAAEPGATHVVVQNFTDEELEALLAEAGLGKVDYLTPDHTWLTASPVFHSGQVDD